jgi:hypothetical protein
MNDPVQFWIIHHAFMRKALGEVGDTQVEKQGYFLMHALADVQYIGS